MSGLYDTVGEQSVSVSMVWSSSPAFSLSNAAAIAADSWAAKWVVEDDVMSLVGLVMDDPYGPLNLGSAFPCRERSGFSGVASRVDGESLSLFMGFSFGLIVAPMAINRRTESRVLALFDGSPEEGRKGSAEAPLLCRRGEIPMAAAFDDKRSGIR